MSRLGNILGNLWAAKPVPPAPPPPPRRREPGEMTHRQATAYRLAGISMEDARLHDDVTIRGRTRKVGIRAYTVLGIVWIGDVPHWRAAAMPLTANGRAVDSRNLRVDWQQPFYALVSDLLDGVGEPPEIAKLAGIHFLATKRLTSGEIAGLKEKADRKIVTVAESSRPDHHVLAPEEIEASEAGGEPS